MEKQQLKVQKLLKSGDKTAPAKNALLTRLVKALGDAKPARQVEMTKDEKEMIRELDLLTLKPILYVANVSEEEAADASGNPHVKALTEYAEKEGAQVITISAKVEEDIASLPADEAKEYLEMEGLTEAGLDRLIKAGFSLLGLQTFLTAGEMDPVPGPSSKDPRRLRQPARSIRTLKKASSVQKSFPTMTSLPAAASRLPVKKALCDWKARTTSCRTAMSSNSASTYKKE